MWLPALAVGILHPHVVLSEYDPHQIPHKRSISRASVTDSMYFHTYQLWLCCNIDQKRYTTFVRNHLQRVVRTNWWPKRAHTRQQENAVADNDRQGPRSNHHASYLSPPIHLHRRQRGHRVPRGIGGTGTTARCHPRRLPRPRGYAIAGWRRRRRYPRYPPLLLRSLFAPIRVRRFTELGQRHPKSHRFSVAHHSCGRSMSVKSGLCVGVTALVRGTRSRVGAWPGKARGGGVERGQCKQGKRTTLDNMAGKKLRVAVECKCNQLR